MARGPYMIPNDRSITSQMYANDVSTLYDVQLYLGWGSEEEAERYDVPPTTVEFERSKRLKSPGLKAWLSKQDWALNVVSLRVTALLLACHERDIPHLVGMGCFVYKRPQARPGVLVRRLQAAGFTLDEIGRAECGEPVGEMRRVALNVSRRQFEMEKLRRLLNP